MKAVVVTYVMMVIKLLEVLLENVWLMIMEWLIGLMTYLLVQVITYPFYYVFFDNIILIFKQIF